jgi:hypothetical protein
MNLLSYTTATYNSAVMCFAQGMQTNYVNLALKKPTWQSSLYGTYTSNLAVDGNKNAYLSWNSCSHTGVNVTNRGDVYGELFSLKMV